ncbi:LysR family transcriptional regulator [Tardiphaga alba]|uniref:LysR family transcriptional regulator n=1 Tax=Tardiphaga alba TaxID=340268 RepID=A0ABX8AAH8_9BRAD|nr:LysR family transcriptional regulator [Tardiphaga alba]QUS38795.1 LysR family transcriptional regulator [Tardiphaga alba]
MDWDLCRTFNAVAHAGSYLGAARQLRSSHPTVSREIAALEKQLGTKLFVRSDKGLVLTARGRRFHENTQAMAHAALKAEASAAATGAGARGVVKVSIGPTLANFWLMPHVGGFLRDHPHVEIQFVTHPFPVSVRKREADIVLRLHQAGDENLTGRKVARLGTGFYASSDYAARHGLPEQRGAWKDHTVIGFADKATNPELGRWSDHVTRDATVAMRCSSQADMLAAVRAGIGICVLSCIVGDAHADLVRVAPQKLTSQSDIWLLAHPDLTDQPPVRAVLEFLAARAKADRTQLRGH